MLKHQRYVQAFQGPKCDGALDHFHQSRFEDFKSSFRRIIFHFDSTSCDDEIHDFALKHSNTFHEAQIPTQHRLLVWIPLQKFTNEVHRQQMTATPILGDATRMTNEQFSMERSTEGRCKSKYGKSTNYKTASITTISL